MKVIFFDYALTFLSLIFVSTFITFTTRVINLVISLMFSSFLTSFILLRLSYEYLAFTYLIIYFGAVIMLFLFVIMLLDIDNIFENMQVSLNINTFFCFVIFLKFISLAVSFFTDGSITFVDDNEYFVFYINWVGTFSLIDTFLVFFNYYWMWLIIIGWLLFVVMVGLVNTLVDTHINMLQLYENKA